MFSKSLLAFGTLFISGINGAIYCDNEYNTSSCANTTLSTGTVYVCRGFLSCKDSHVVDTSCDLKCYGDRSCKNVDYDNDDNDEMYAFGYQSADSLKMKDKANDAYCYGYQSCIDIVYEQDTEDNDADAFGYQAMYGAYIDYSDDVDSRGYQGLYYSTINTTTVNNNAMDVTVTGYYGSYETDVLCQDGITCNFYAYGYYATEETYLYCLPGSTCNVYCGDTNGCVGMNMYCYSTATCYYDCDDASECPSLSSAYSLSVLSALTVEEKNDGTKRYTDDEFNKIKNDRLDAKYQKQYEYKQERLREEKQYMKQQQNNQQNNAKSATVSNNGNNVFSQSTLIESGIILTIGMFIGVLGNYGYDKCMAKKDYQYQSIV